MGWWSSLKRKVFGSKSSSNDDAATPPETTELTFDNPLLEFSFNVITDWGSQIGGLMPVIKKFSLDPVMSTVSEAQINNIKAILPVLGTDLIITYLSYYMTAPEDPSKENDPASTWYLAATSTLMLLQLSLQLYDISVGRKHSLNVLAERQFTPVNTSTSTTLQPTAPCTDDCLSFQVVLNGNIYKALHNYTNLWFIDTRIKPLPVVGPWLGFYLEVMAEGRYLLDLGTSNYCREHKTLKPETALAYGFLFNRHRYLWERLLIDLLGVPTSHAYTLYIMKEIPLILSTALICYLNPKPINRYKAPLPTEKLSLKTRFYKRACYTLYDPLGQYESMMEWIFEAFLIGFASQISRELQKPGAEIDWEEINKQFQILNNNVLFKKTKAIALPKFLQSWENLANHPPIKHQWEHNRKQLLTILEKIFQVKNSTIGQAAGYKPQYAAPLIQYFLGIKASIAQELIIKLGDDNVMTMLHSFYWWLGTHGAHVSVGLEGVTDLIVTKDHEIKYAPIPGFSRQKFQEQSIALLTCPVEETPGETTAKTTIVPLQTIMEESDPIPENPFKPTPETAEIIPLHKSTPTFFNPMPTRQTQPPKQNAEPLSRKSFREQFLEENNSAGSSVLRNRSQNASFFLNSDQSVAGKANLITNVPST